MKMQELENKSLAMAKGGKPVHGLALDVLIDLALKELKEKEK